MTMTITDHAAAANAIICECQQCHRTTTTDRAVRTSLASRGGRVAYLCNHCASGYNDASYFSENKTRRGTLASEPFTYAVEFEACNVTPQLRSEFAAFEWMPSYDCTTDVEFKSPILNSLKPLPKKLATIEKLLADGYGAVTDGDGTHMHVGHATCINEDTMTYLRRFAHSLFVPLSRYLEEHEDEAALVYGRALKRGGWAEPIDMDTDPMIHENFINLQHEETIEFRLCKFCTAKQYSELAKMNRDMASAIVNNFIRHFNDDVDNLAAHRKHKADVTAQKLIRIFKKYAKAAPTWY